MKLRGDFVSNLLVTGITGRSGRYLGDILIKNNYPDVTALIRNKEKFEKLFGKPENLKYKICDISDVDEIATIIKEKQIDTIFHIYNIKHSVGIVKAAIASSCVKRIILVHTTGIYSKFKSASSEYIEIENTIYNLLKDSEIAVTILRPTMIYGSLDDKNISSFIKMVDKLRLFPLVNGGKYELQPVNHIDLGKAYYQVLTNPEKTKNKNYNLSGGTVIYLKDILKNISKFLGKKTVFFSVPFWFAYFIAKVLYWLTLKKIDFRERVQRLVEPRAYEHNAAIDDFGYSPINFLDGLEKEVKEYIEAKNK